MVSGEEGFVRLTTGYGPWNGINTAGIEGYHMDRCSIPTSDFFLPWLAITTGGKHILVCLIAIMYYQRNKQEHQCSHFKSAFKGFKRLSLKTEKVSCIKQYVRK